jgi:RND family efflux transporter MFP subunit
MTGNSLLPRLDTAVLLAAIVALLSGCGGDGDVAAGAGGVPSRAALIRVDQITREPVRPFVAAVGTIMPRRTSVVSSGADGKVDQFLVREGDIVDEEQEFSILNMVTTNLEIQEAEAVLREREQEFQEMQGSRKEEIDEAKARMEAAQATSEIAADRLARMQRLNQGGAVIADNLDDARERAQAAEKMLAAAMANYELVKAGPREEDRLQAKARLDAQQHHVDYLKAERDKRTTRAPFPGVVVREHTESGQWLAKADPVVTLADLIEEVHVVAHVDQRELRNVQVGAEVTVEVDGVTPREWTGKVISLIPRSQWETGSRTFPVKVAIKNELVTIEGRERPVLNEGMLARLIFEGPPHDALLAPKNALIRSETGTRLYTVKTGEKPNVGTAIPVVVQEGRAYADRVEILQGDLEPGMAVVTEGAERLTPFADVIIQPQQPASGGAATAESGEAAKPPKAAKSDSATSTGA